MTNENIIEEHETEQILKERIKNIIQNIFQDEEYGFEVYIEMKSAPILKRFNLSEGRIRDKNNPEKNFKKKIQLSLEEAIKEKFIETDKKYDMAENVADDQNKFYVITQNEDYNPFNVTQSELNNIENYQANERENARGIFFRFERSGNIFWAYQFLYQNAIPNRKGMGFHIIPSEGDIFEELKKPILLLSKRIDLLIIGDEIICDKIDFMQKNFGFQEFVKSTAAKVVNSIQNLELVSNLDKVSAYIGRSKLLYAKKMMRIKDSKVLQKTSDELYERVTTVPRWQGVFNLDVENHKLVINTYQQVENLIDLLDERYTRSDITGEEYDTSAKKWIAPIG